MHVISVNIGKATIISWKGKELSTGIFKKPVDVPVFLDIDDVVSDKVIDRKYHGGKDKACYIFSGNHYPYWKKIYPNLSWEWGMFGENLTVASLSESEILIGDIYRIGEAVVQVSQPRQPCFKLGIRFGDQKIVKEFVTYGYSGAYLRILEKGYVKAGDNFELIEKNNNGLSVKEIFRLLYQQEQEDKTLIDNALGIESLAESCKRDLIRLWKL